MGSKKVCPFEVKSDNSLYHRQIQESVPSVPKRALFRRSKIIPCNTTSYNKVCPAAPGFLGEREQMLKITLKKRQMDFNYVEK